MIKNCFMDEQPKFLKEVKVDGEKIATIKALSRNDRAEIEEKATTKELKNGEIVLKMNWNRMQIVQMKCALKTWEFDRAITEENIGLLPDKYFDAIDQAIQKMESDWKKNKADISKNSKKQSD